MLCLKKNVLTLFLLAALSSCGGESNTSRSSTTSVGNESADLTNSQTPTNNISEQETLTAQAGEDKTVRIRESITITGSGISPNSNIVSYLWKKDDTVLARTASFTYRTAIEGDGNVEKTTLTLTVIDQLGKQASDSFELTVTPTAEALGLQSNPRHKTIELGETVTFWGHGNIIHEPPSIDTNNNNYTWKSKGVFVATGRSFDFTPLSTGEKIFTLFYKTKGGYQLKDSVTIIVTPYHNDKPTIKAQKDVTIRHGDSVELSVETNDSDGWIAHTDWVADDTNWDNDRRTFNVSDTKFGWEEHELFLGDTQFTITVTDNEGLKASDTLTLTVLPNAGEDKVINVGDAVNLIGLGHYKGKSEYQWKQGDTLLANTQSFSYTSQSVGEYFLTHTVTSKNGEQQSSDEVKITVVKRDTLQAQIQGALKNATIKIFQLEETGSKNLLFTETTDEKGKFNSHSETLDNNKFYIYQATGGIDTANNKINNGVVRAIIKGSQAKTEAFNISIATEVAYQVMLRAIDNNYSASNLQDRINQWYNKESETGQISTNHFTSYNDWLLFDYKLDRESLNNNLNTGTVLIDSIYNNTPSLIYSSLFPEHVPISVCEWWDYCDNDDYLNAEDERNDSRPYLSIYSHDKFAVSKDKTLGFSLQGVTFKVINLINNSLLSELQLSHEGSEILLSINNEKAYIRGSDHLSIIDISEPSHPLTLGVTDDIYTSGLMSISDDQETIFIKKGRSKLQIIDVSNTNSTNQHSRKFEGKDVRVSADKKRILVLNRDKLSIYNFSNFTLLGTYDNLRVYDSSNVGDFVSYSPNGNKAFIKTGSYSLKILDISQPSNIKLLDEDTDFDFTYVTYSPDGKLAFLDSRTYLRTVDISKLDEVTLLEELTYGFLILDKITFSPDGKTALLISGQDVRIKKISSPEEYAQLYRYEVDGSSDSVVTYSPDGRKAFVVSTPSNVDLNDHIKIFDISETSSVTLLEDYELAEFVDITFSKDGTRANIFSGKSIQTFDISDQKNLIQDKVLSSYRE